jgi:hypothetical protein
MDDLLTLKQHQRLQQLYRETTDKVQRDPVELVLPQELE